MPIQVDWYKETKNLSYNFEGKWSWDDLLIAIDEVVARLDTLDEPVYLIIDVHKSGFVPTFAYNSLKQVASAPTMSHPNTRQLLVVGANRYVELMVNVFKKAFPASGKRYLLFKTFTDMEHYIAENQEESR